MKRLILLFVFLTTWFSSVNSMNPNIQMSEIRRQLGDIDQQAKEQFLEWKLSNGNISSMDLMEKVLSYKPDAHLFEEYLQRDISSGIGELNELADEWKKANALNISEEEREKVHEALDGIDISQNLTEWSTEKLEERLKKKMHLIEQRAKVKVDFEVFENITLILSNAYKKVDETFAFAEEKNNSGSLTKDDTKKLEDKIYEIYETFFELSELIKGSDVESIFYDDVFKVYPVTWIKDKIKLMEAAENATKILGDVAPFLTSLGEEMKQIEEFRDGNLIERVKRLAQKIEDTVGNTSEVGIRKNVMKEYENNESASKFLQNIFKFSRFVNRVIQQFHTMKKRCTPLMDHFDQLQIPPGNLSETFVMLQRCAQLPIDLRQEIDNFTSLLQPLEEVQTSESKIREFSHFLIDIELQYSQFRISRYDLLKEGVEAAILNNSIWKKDLETRQKIDVGLKENAVLFMVTQETLNKIDFEKANQTITEILSKANEIVECYSQLAIPNTKSLVNLPPKVWNFDPRPTRHLVESVIGFKKIHKMMVELNEWKFERKMESFELEEEDVNAISEGVEVFEQLKDIDVLLNEMNELSGLNGTEVEDAWKTVKNALGSLNKELSEHLPILESNLTHLQSAISTIQLPSDLPIQLIVDWVNSNLKGIVHSEYSKTLQRIMTLDFANYSSKLDKLSHAIDKWSQHKKPAEPQEEEKNKNDCLVNYSDKCRLPRSEL
uniref:DHC_N2 domain-containing protein n=1 Tax=Caenorhabditis tropicalis TaxID=1561998 RepID=A0A1I7T6P6_9PELO